MKLFIVAFVITVYGCSNDKRPDKEGKDNIDCYWTVRNNIENALSGDESAVGRLKGWLKGQPEECFFNSIRLLPKELALTVLDPEIPRLINHNEPMVRYLLAGTMIRIDPQKYSDNLRAMVDDPMDSVGKPVREFYCISGNMKYCGIDKEKAEMDCREKNPKIGIFPGPSPSGVYPNAERGKKVFIEYMCLGGRAERSGFRIGDEPLSVNDVVVDSPRSFVGEVMKANFPIVIRLRRDGKEMEINVKE